MSAKAYILVEERLDEAFLRRTLPKRLLKNVKIVVGNGRYGAISMAVSLLVAKQIPVALVVDSDTNDAKQIKAQERFLRAELQHYTPGLPFEVALIVPNLETMLLGEDASRVKKEEMQQKIDELDARRLQDLPVVIKLVQFLEGVVHHQDAVS